VAEQLVDQLLVRHLDDLLALVDRAITFARAGIDGSTSGR
jgi:hypothetical protein